MSGGNDRVNAGASPGSDTHQLHAHDLGPCGEVASDRGRRRTRVQKARGHDRHGRVYAAAQELDGLCHVSIANDKLAADLRSTVLQQVDKTHSWDTSSELDNIGSRVKREGRNAHGEWVQQHDERARLDVIKMLGKQHQVNLDRWGGFSNRHVS